MIVSTTVWYPYIQTLLVTLYANKQKAPNWVKVITIIFDELVYTFIFVFSTRHNSNINW